MMVLFLLLMCLLCIVRRANTIQMHLTKCADETKSDDNYAN